MSARNSTIPRPGSPTWVIGHKNPDTDAICSALAYADLLRQTRIPEARAACCGPPNTRTEWVLNKAGATKPRLMSDVFLRASDICRKEVVSALQNETVIEAYRRMTEHNIRSVPVVDVSGTMLYQPVVGFGAVGMKMLTMGWGKLDCMPALSIPVTNPRA